MNGSVPECHARGSKAPSTRFQPGYRPSRCGSRCTPSWCRRQGGAAAGNGRRGKKLWVAERGEYEDAFLCGAQLGFQNLHSAHFIERDDSLVQDFFYTRFEVQVKSKHPLVRFGGVGVDAWQGQRPSAQWARGHKTAAVVALPRPSRAAISICNDQTQSFQRSNNTYILTISKNDTRMICANIIIGNSKKNIIIGKKREIYKIKSQPYV